MKAQTNKIRQEKEIKGVQVGKRKTISICRLHGCLCRNSQNTYQKKKKFPELSEFGKNVETQDKMQQSLKLCQRR